jgi:nucleotide-binding universal stress UspA family protein
VFLATFGVPFDERAAEFAVDSALESGVALIVANVVEIGPLPLSFIMGYDQLPDPPVLAASLRAPAELARSLGVQVERLRVKTLHPISALLDVVAERSPGLLVFGPDRKRMRRFRYWRAARAVRESAPCLVWLPD